MLLQTNSTVLRAKIEHALEFTNLRATEFQLVTFMRVSAEQSGSENIFKNVMVHKSKVKNHWFYAYQTQYSKASFDPIIKIFLRCLLLRNLRYKDDFILTCIKKKQMFGEKKQQDDIIAF